MSKQLPVIACTHKNLNHIIETENGERVCRCGVVLEEKIPERFVAVPSSQGKVSLYHQVEVGGSPKDMKAVNNKIHVYVSGSSEFSNICDRLFMKDFTQKRAWHIYQTLRSNSGFSRAKCAIFSVYVACRENDQPVDEEEIQNTVQSILSVKNTPNALSAISELHETALNLGINSNEGHAPRYYLNLEIKKVATHFAEDPSFYNLFRKKATKYFDCLSGNSQNKASRAVNITLCSMGLK